MVTDSFSKFFFRFVCYSQFVGVNICFALLLFVQFFVDLTQCCGSASVITRIQDPKNVHMDPDPRG